MTEFEWLLQQQEGQFFERKSCYERSTGAPKRRDVRAIAWDVAKTLAAMANADGGSLAVGLEDDATVTGVDYPDDRLRVILEAPRTHIRPPVRAQSREATLLGKRILLFEVDWSWDTHQLTDGRYLLRVGDQNMPFAAGDIAAIKEGRRRRLTETQFVHEASLSDLDLRLIAELVARNGLDEAPEDTILRYRLGERRNGKLLLTLAACLLFGKDPGRWHPRCGIDFVKYEGTQRGVGSRLNVVKRERLEAPLVRLIHSVYLAIQPHVRERQQLVDLFFEERLEYPTSAWQEAIVNAVAHRDYRYEGAGIEVCMFDDRLEVRSPGELVEPVTLERLLKRERIHASRNPRIARVLTDFGYMREQGEGIPRMFEAMERQGLYPPQLKLEAGAIFNVTLRNTPVYSIETMRWLAQYEPLGLNGHQKRLLAYAKQHSYAFTSRAYQGLVDIDIYTASRDIKDLMRKGLVRLSRKGGRVYELLPAPARQRGEKPEELIALEPILAAKGFVTNREIRDKLGLSPRQAARIADLLVNKGWLKPQGERRWRRYLADG